MLPCNKGHHTISGCGKREAHSNWSMAKPVQKLISLKVVEKLYIYHKNIRLLCREALIMFGIGLEPTT